MAKRSDDWKATLRSAALTNPQPIAVSASQVLRSRTSAETVDACLKAGEVLARYLASLVLSSYSVRDDAENNASFFDSIGLDGSLAFGKYLAVVQKGASAPFKHPIAPYINPFAPKKKGKGSADEALTDLLELRNRIGHNISAMSEAKAHSVLANDKPHLELGKVLTALQGVLSLPLFVVEAQQLAKGQIIGRVLWLMGDSQDPEPIELCMDRGLHEVKQPYISCNGQALQLWPCLIWKILTRREAFGLMLVDGVGDKELSYQALDGWKASANGASVSYLKSTMAGDTRNEEHIALINGKTLDQHWSVEKRLRIEAAAQIEGSIPWQDLDQDTIRWYADRLGSEDSEDPVALIEERLFDGRDRFFEHEVVQSLLLFGTEDVVRQALRREMLDLRARTTEDERWDERVTGSENVLVSLRQAVDFFARYVGMEDASMEDLTATSGSADYLAMREALVNLFIHQDYADASAAAQVELQPLTAVFFNTGFSLVDDARLKSGGRSQSRNPIIARALRLIGFAELAGSGIRALQRAWNQEARVPPQFKSDREANTFTVLLDWRASESVYDKEWMDRLGVKLSGEHVQILELACAHEGITKSQLLDLIGQFPDNIQTALGHLQTQGLIDEQNGVYRTKEHIREMIEE